MNGNDLPAAVTAMLVVGVLVATVGVWLALRALAGAVAAVFRGRR